MLDESTIARLLNSKDFVIIDSCTFTCRNLFYELYAVEAFREVNEESIREELEQRSLFLRVLECKSSVTIPSITSELRTYCEILGDKVSYLRSGPHYRNPLGSRRTKGRMRKNNSENNCYSRKDLLTKLQELSFEVYKMSKEKEFIVSSPRFDYLVDMVKLIDRAVELKKDTSYVYRHHELPNPHKSDTDEKIVASLLWKSMFSADFVAVLTRDTDFPRLLGVVPKLIGSNAFLPHNEYFRGRLMQNPINLFMIDDATKRIGTVCYGDYKYENFRIYGYSQEENQEAQEKILELWKRFSERK